MLEIRLLGKFAVTIEGHPVELRLRAAQSLLAYLALTAGTPHRREQLAGLLWPDADEASAKGNLRHTLWRIRKALGPHDIIIADDLTLSWNSAAEFWLDANFVGQKLPADASAEDLIAAVSAYGGELLPGFYDDWVVLERERLQAAFEHKMEALLGRLMTAERWEDVLEWGERWIALGHTPEAAYRALITAYGGRGDSAGAAATYRRCLQALQSDLGVEPSALTRALAQAAPLFSAQLRMTPKTNLPSALSSFIGREKEIAQLKQMMADHRLVTLTGMGGVGKTRLTLAVAAELLGEFADGVWHVELASVSDLRLVPQAVAMALDVHEERGRLLSATLADYLRDKAALLVWDNCEHVIEACAPLADYLLQRCPYMRLLASSREALGVEGETAYPVPSLSLPSEEAPGLEALQQSEAVRLFVERATEVLPAFRLTEANAPAVVQVCRRLDGMALAIELAAARVKLLKVKQIAARLDDAFRLLTGGNRTALPRQQTLRATLDWSHQLLSETERAVLRRLAVFAGSWTLEAAEAVCAGEGVEALAVLDLLAQLANKSLVVLERKPGHEARYSLLETVRQYAREKWLAAGEEERVRQQHLAYFLGLAQAAELKLYDSRQLEGLAQLDTEQNNLRAAMGWALEKGLEAGLELAGALFWYWHLRCYWADGYAWLQKALAAGPGVAKPLRARLLSRAGHLVRLMGNFKQAVAYSEESIALFREVGDKAGLAFPLGTLGRMIVFQDSARGEALLEESLGLYREVGNKWGSRNVLGSLGQVAAIQGQFDQAGTCWQESLVLARELGVPDGIAWALNGLGHLAFVQGDYERAMALFTESLPVSQAVKHKRFLLGTLFSIAVTALYLGWLEQAKALAREYLELCQEMGAGMSWRIGRFGVDQPYKLAFALENLALAEKSGDQPTIASVLFGVATHLWALGQLDKGVRLYAAARAASASILTHFTPLERADFDHALTGILLQLDEATFQKAWAEGSVMTVEQAVAYAREPAQ